METFLKITILSEEVLLHAFTLSLIWEKNLGRMTWITESLHYVCGWYEKNGLKWKRKWEIKYFFSWDLNFVWKEGQNIGLGPKLLLKEPVKLLILNS